MKEKDLKIPDFIKREKNPIVLQHGLKLAQDHIGFLEAENKRLK